MNTDFRITVGYFKHPKIKKLRKRLGPDAVIAHLQLLEFTATMKPGGVFTGMSDEDVILASEYNGRADFLAVLVELRLLDLIDDIYRVHNWQLRNPWAFGAEKRSENGRLAANSRWEKVREASETHANANATSCETQCETHAVALRNDTRSNAPLLSFPILSKEEKNPPLPPLGEPPSQKGDVSSLFSEVDEGAERVAVAEASVLGFDQPAAFAHFWSHYPRKDSKDAAEKRFRVKVKTQAVFEDVMAGLVRAKLSDQWEKDNGKFIPHAATWLVAGGWKDEEKPKAKSAYVEPDPMTLYKSLTRPYVPNGARQ